MKNANAAFADGEYRLDLLFSGDELAHIANHPMAIWKMQNRYSSYRQVERMGF